MVCPSDHSYSSDDDTAYDLIDHPIATTEPRPLDTAASLLSTKSAPVADEEAELPHESQMQQEKADIFSSLDRPAGWTREMVNDHEKKLREEVESLKKTAEYMEAFDTLAIDDEKVIEYARRIGREMPYDILLASIRMNGVMRPEETSHRLGHSKYELTMRVGKHEARVECTSLKEGRQRAAQALLKMLHPGMDTWGSVLRLFSHSSNDDLDETKRNLDGREQRLLVDKLAAEALSKRLTAHLEEAELKQKRLEAEKKTLQDQLTAVYAQIGEKELNYDKEKEKYQVKIAELTQSLLDAEGKDSKIAEKNKENEVLRFNFENEKAIRESALEKFKRADAHLKFQEGESFRALKEMIVVDLILFAFHLLWFISGVNLGISMALMLFTIVLASLSLTYEGFKQLKASERNVKTNVETFIHLVTSVIRDEERTRLASTATETTAEEFPDQLKHRTVLLKKDNGSFGISIYGSHIYRVTPGSAADRAGIQAFDQIMAIDDNENVSSEEIISKMEKTVDGLKLVVRFNPVGQRAAL